MLNFDADVKKRPRVTNVKPPSQWKPGETERVPHLAAPVHHDAAMLGGAQRERRQRRQERHVDEEVEHVHPHPVRLPTTRKARGRCCAGARSAQALRMRPVLTSRPVRLGTRWAVSACSVRVNMHKV